MKRYSLRRRQAAFGADGAVMAAATLAAAGMTTAAQLKGSKEQAEAAKDAATKQANSIINSAKVSSEAITRSAENNRQLQEQQMDLTKQLHKEQQDKQSEFQTNILMLAGAENMDDRKRSSMQIVKYGGRANRKFSLRGNRNVQFAITDGGKKVLKGYTPEGFALYKFIGDTHNQSHKLPNGKPATGIGIDLSSNNNNKEHEKMKYGGNSDIEAEGGEYALSTPTDVLFISKHNIGGFNPAKAIEKGMNPIDAFLVQEGIKHNIGKRKLRLVGGVGFNPYTSILMNNVDNIMTDDAAVGLVAGTRKFKYGGKCVPRRKALSGTAWGAIGDFGGAGISTIGNILGAGIISGATNKGAGIMSNAYNTGADYMVDAYNKMKGIDLSNLSSEDFQASHYLPAIRNYQVSAAPRTTLVNRSANRLINAAKNKSLSSAAFLNRVANIENDRVSKNFEAYDNAERASEAIKQENAKAINEASQYNAAMDAQAKKDYTTAKLDLLKYNNELENNKLLGIAGARSGAITQSAQAFADAKQANAQSWDNALSSSANAFGSAFSNLGNRIYSTKNILLGADADARINYIAENGSQTQIAKEANRWQTMADNATNDNLKTIYQQRADLLNARLSKKSRNKLSTTPGLPINDSARDGYFTGYDSGINFIS